jgi:hypothetical protein
MKYYSQNNGYSGRHLYMTPSEYAAAVSSKNDMFCIRQQTPHFYMWVSRIFDKCCVLSKHPIRDLQYKKQTYWYWLHRQYGVQLSLLTLRDFTDYPQISVGLLT